MPIEPTSLSTERLLLRPFAPGDVADALAYRNDHEFARFLRHLPQPYTLRDAQAFVALNIAEPWDLSPVFAVVLRRRVVGTVNLEVDPPARSAMLGYAIARACWGQGIAVEAARAVVAWAFATFDVTSIWASTDLRNLRSQQVMRKLGMQYEASAAGDGLDREGQPFEEVRYRLPRP
jgi:ribosomal-protein-alanine N-acetyltransferase